MSRRGNPTWLTPGLTWRDVTFHHCRPGRGLDCRRDAFTLFILLRDSLLAFPKRPTVAHLSYLIAAIEVTSCIMHIGLTRRDGEKREGKTEDKREKEKERKGERESEKQLVYKGASRYTRVQFKFLDRLTPQRELFQCIYTFKCTRVLLSARYNAKWPRIIIPAPFYYRRLSTGSWNRMSTKYAQQNRVASGSPFSGWHFFFLFPSRENRPLDLRYFPFRRMLPLLFFRRRVRCGRFCGTDSRIRLSYPPHKSWFSSHISRRE